jgi:hypothetical protein
MHKQFNNHGTKLFAKWKRGQDPTCDDPAEIHWENGKPASLDDHIRHLDETHLTKKIDGRIVRIMFPDIVADVRFDKNILRWVCQAPGQPRVIMELSDPDIDDYAIIAELYAYPLVYRAVIHRD